MLFRGEDNSPLQQALLLLSADSGSVRVQSVVRAVAGSLCAGWRVDCADGLPLDHVMQALALLGVTAELPFSAETCVLRFDAFLAFEQHTAILYTRNSEEEAAFSLAGDACGATLTFLPVFSVRAATIRQQVEFDGLECDTSRVRKLLELVPISGASRFPRMSARLAIRRPDSGNQPSLAVWLDAARTISDPLERACVARHLLCLHAPLPDVLEVIPDGTPLEALDLELSSEYVHIAWAAASEPQDASPLPSTPHRTLQQAILEGISAIRLRFAENHWRDYLMPAGESDTWTTAWVLYHMSALHAIYGDAALQEQLSAAAHWLSGHLSPGGAWGYSITTNSDADSTSLAILGLRRLGFSIPSSATELLHTCRKAEGGFSTYPDSEALRNAWTLASAEVSTFACEAAQVAPEFEDLTFQFLNRSQLANGLWGHYWWTSPLYATWMALNLYGMRAEVPRRLDVEQTLLAYEPCGAFETALLLLCLKQPGLSPAPREVIHNLVQRLVQMQREDGSWPPSAWFYLPRTEVVETSEEIDPGEMYCDRRGTFTTVAAIMALHSVLSSV